MIKTVFIVINPRGRPVATGSTEDLAIKSFEKKTGLAWDGLIKRSWKQNGYEVVQKVDSSK